VGGLVSAALPGVSPGASRHRAPPGTGEELPREPPVARPAARPNGNISNFLLFNYLLEEADEAIYTSGWISAYVNGFSPERLIFPTITGFNL